MPDSRYRHTGHVGLELQHELVARGENIPIIFITAHGAETMRSCLIDLGAVEVLPKPFDDEALSKALNTAFEGR
jgi:FixJ family two-component response regulator